MPTTVELAKQLNTDPRNVLIHINTAVERGVSLAGWIEYLKSLPAVKDIAEQLGVTENTAVRKFRKWASLNGVKPEHYVYYEEKRFMYKGELKRAVFMVYKAPPEFVEWLKNWKTLISWPSIRRVSQMLKLPYGLVKAEFEAWCDRRKEDMEKYLYNKTFHLPPEFVEYLRNKYGVGR